LPLRFLCFLCFLTPLFHFSYSRWWKWWKVSSPSDSFGHGRPIFHHQTRHQRLHNANHHVSDLTQDGTSKTIRNSRKHRWKNDAQCCKQTLAICISLSIYIYLYKSLYIFLYLICLYCFLLLPTWQRYWMILTPPTPPTMKLAWHFKSLGYPTHTKTELTEVG
jgi:hypothetical protein